MKATNRILKPLPRRENKLECSGASSLERLGRLARSRKGGKVSFAKEEGEKKEKERKNALWEKKSPRARPLVNDLRVKPTAAAAQAAAASAPREAARVDVDVGGRGAPPGRVARGTGLAGGASAGVSSGPSRGRRRRRCCLRGPGHVGCFFFFPFDSPPTPTSMQFTWEGGG